jgi:ADP-dependent NAD(P)H-hydrate dehydratase
MASDLSIPGLPVLPQRDPGAHKGNYGLALIVGSSRGMSGAAALAGMAALRGGAGLVRLAVPDVCLPTVAAFEPSYMTVPLASDRRGRISLDALPQILEHAGQATALALGPGVGRSLGLDSLVARLYATLSLPLVLDADGLNALAARMDEGITPAGPRVLTPHPGEFERLAGFKPRSEDERVEAAARLASRLGAVVVLKGHRTVVSDGQRTILNTTGNPGMATGGSGDVLTGLIAALICQNLSPFEAAHLGVHLHGLAGDIAAESLGHESLTALDLVTHLPAAFGRGDQ